MGQALFLTDPGKRVSSRLISPGRVWDCVACSGKGGSWQSNVGAHHCNQSIVPPSISSCKPTTSKSLSGPPPLSGTMWLSVSHVEYSLLHRRTLMPSDPPFLLPQETDTQSQP